MPVKNLFFTLNNICILKLRKSCKHLELKEFAQTLTSPVSCVLSPSGPACEAQGQEAEYLSTQKM